MRNLQDDTPEADRYFEKARTEMLPFLPADAETFLDIGCASGVFGEAIKKSRQATVWGIEIHAESGVEAGKKLDHVLIGDAGELIDRLPDSYFDCIICNDVLEHMILPGTLLRRLRPKLKPNGRLVGSIPNIRYIHNLIPLIVRGEWQYCASGILDSTHLRFFTQKSWTCFLKWNGYEIVMLKGVNGVKPFSKSGILCLLLNLLLLGTASDLDSPQFACVARLSDLPPDTDEYL